MDYIVFPPEIGFRDFSIELVEFNMILGIKISLLVH